MAAWIAVSADGRGPPGLAGRPAAVTIVTMSALLTAPLQRPLAVMVNVSAWRIRAETLPAVPSIQPRSYSDRLIAAMSRVIDGRNSRDSVATPVIRSAGVTSKAGL